MAALPRRGGPSTIRRAITISARGRDLSGLLRRRKPDREDAGGGLFEDWLSIAYCQPLGMKIAEENVHSLIAVISQRLIEHHDIRSCCLRVQALSGIDVRHVPWGQEFCANWLRGA